MTWLERASKRHVLRKEKNSFTVSGNIEGDKKSTYRVTLDLNRGYCNCDCYNEYGGIYRKKYVCTHVGAVLLSLFDERKAMELRHKLRWNPQKEENVLRLFPKKEFYPEQKESILWLYSRMKDGSRGAILSAPPGTGKSAILYTILRVKGGIYLTPLNSLVDQVENDPDLDVAVVKGKKNYPCIRNEGETAEACNVWYILRQLHDLYRDGAISYDELQIRLKREDCREMCPYYSARAEFERSIKNKRVGVTNVDLFLYTGYHAPVICVDECQNLINKMEEFYKVRLNATEQSALQNAKREIVQLRDQITKLEIKLTSRPGNIDLVKKKERLTRRLEKLEWFINDVKHGGKWTKSGDFFYPVESIRLIRELEKRCGFIVFSSATPNLPPMYPKREAKHPFPVKNRMVYIKPVCKFSKDYREKNMKKMADAIENTVRVYNKKAIVHCHAYSISEGLYEYLKEDSIVQKRDGMKEALENWRNSSKRIFLSVNFEEGIDLKGSEYYLSIIPVVPFPDVSDPLVKAKREIDPEWFARQTSTTIMQACGRVTRSMDDSGCTFILDSNFVWFYKQNRDYFEKWFHEAVQFIKKNR